MSEPKHLRVLSLGAGVQSTTVYLLAMDGKIPPFDAAIFADTQEEPAAVYGHLAWLRSLGGPTIIVRTIGKLGDHLLRGQNSTGGRFASIPAFTAPAGITPATGMTRRQCTREYKTEVVERTTRRELFGLPPKQGLRSHMSIEVVVGISADEAGRAIKVRKRVEARKRWVAVFPLLDMRWTRADCQRYLSVRCPDQVVPRSACVFCPFKSDDEWRLLKAGPPVDWNRACEVDYGLRRPGAIVNRKLDQQLFLHRSAKPLAEVDFDALAAEDSRQGWLSFAQECTGMCGN